MVTTAIADVHLSIRRGRCRARGFAGPPVGGTALAPRRRRKPVHRTAHREEGRRFAGPPGAVHACRRSPASEVRERAKSPRTALRCRSSVRGGPIAPHPDRSSGTRLSTTRASIHNFPVAPPAAGRIPAGWARDRPSARRVARRMSDRVCRAAGRPRAAFPHPRRREPGVRTDGDGPGGARPPRTTTVGLDARRRTADLPGTVPGGRPPHASGGARPPAGAAAPDDPSADAGRQARYGWPLRPVPRIGQRFRAPPNPWSPGHRGVDLVGAPGQEVRAARDGVVAFAGPLAGRGVVSVLHPDGLRTTYEPVTATVAVGTVVSRGAVLGTLEPGHPGCPATACLHWGVRRGDADYLDPLVLVGPGQVRLLPDPGDGERP
ncbi:M23 family metallopeptidase [Pseudonocardia benzenivorans]